MAHFVCVVFPGKLVRALCGETEVQSLLLAYRGKLLITSAKMTHGGALLLKVSVFPVQEYLGV